MMNKDGSDVDSDEENEEGDYTVYECPGLAPVTMATLKRNKSHGLGAMHLKEIIKTNHL